MVKDVKSKAHQLKHLIEAANTIGIVGHIRPDGDCVGSTLGLYNYIIDNYKEKKVDVFLENFSSDFNFLNGTDVVKHEIIDKGYDLGISIDCSDTERHGIFGVIFKNAISTVCIDHHISNKGFGDMCYIDAESSSSCEAVCDLIDTDKISKNAAECFYLGMVHDTGVFKYSNTTEKTMQIAGKMISLGAKPEIIIDETFYKKSYKQNMLMAKTILESKLMLDGKVIFGLITENMFKAFNATRMDTDGIVEQLRLTDGVEVAIFVYQSGEASYKFSLRSKKLVNVSIIAQSFNGGGHIRAAGFEVNGSYEAAVDKIVAMIGEQLNV